MRPIRAETDPRKGYVMVHRCEKCGEIKRNKACSDARVQPDDLNLLIQLTVNRELSTRLAFGMLRKKEAVD